MTEDKSAEILDRLDRVILDIIVEAEDIERSTKGHKDLLMTDELREAINSLKPMLDVIAEMKNDPIILAHGKIPQRYIKEIDKINVGALSCAKTLKAFIQTNRQNIHQ